MHHHHDLDNTFTNVNDTNTIATTIGLITENSVNDLTTLGIKLGQ